VVDDGLLAAGLVRAELMLGTSPLPEPERFAKFNGMKALAAASGKTITQTARCDDPIRGPMQWRSVTKTVDDDTVLFEMFSAVAGGKEEKMMEITYTRK